MEPRGWWLRLCLYLQVLFGMLGGCSGRDSDGSFHSLHFFDTYVSEAGQGLPQFVSQGYVDGQLFMSYDSDQRRAKPRAPWMKKVSVDEKDFYYTLSRSQEKDLHSYALPHPAWNNTADERTDRLPKWLDNLYKPPFVSLAYMERQPPPTDSVVPRGPWMKRIPQAEGWDLETETLQGTEHMFREALEETVEGSNHGEGLHTLQRMYGCNLRGGRSTGGFSQYGYDGRDFLTFSAKALNWTATDASAQDIRMRWNENMTLSQAWEDYLAVACVESLRYMLKYNQVPWWRTEPPVVKESHKKSNGTQGTLTCRIYGFHPREIQATWKKDGRVWTQDTYRSGGILPNSDGTFYTWLSIEIDPKERGRYRCNVERVGQRDPEIQGPVILNEPGGSGDRGNPDKDAWSWIVSVSVVLVLFCICIFVAICCCNKAQNNTANDNSCPAQQPYQGAPETERQQNDLHLPPPYSQVCPIDVNVEHTNIQVQPDHGCSGFESADHGCSGFDSAGHGCSGFDFADYSCSGFDFGGCDFAD